jgi:hypothetical protein
MFPVSLFVPTVEAQGEGWLEGWQYRKSHVVNPASGAGTNYQVKLKTLYNSDTYKSETLSGYIRSNGWDSQGRLFAIVGSDVFWAEDGNPKNFIFRWAFPDSPSPNSLFIDSQDRIFVSAYNQNSGKNGRFYRSVNQGESFTEIDTFNGITVSVWNMDEDSDGYLYAGEYGAAGFQAPKVWKSTDGGLNWTDISSPDWVQSPYNHIHNVRVDPSTGWLYAVLGDAGPYLGVWRSKLKERTDWVFKGRDDFIGYPFVSLAFKGGYVYLGADAEDGKIWRFQDDGTSNAQVFTCVYDDVLPNEVFVLETDKSGRLWAGLVSVVENGENKVLTSEDGTTWTLRETRTSPSPYSTFGRGTRVFRALNDFLTCYEAEGGGGYGIWCYWATDAVNLHGHSRVDFGDVCFTDDDGSTLLDYWMESKVDSDNAVFWVEVTDDLSSEAQTIYVYYGKADATTTSNIKNTSLWNHGDDFNDNSQDTAIWDTVIKRTGSPNEVNQRLEIYVPVNGDYAGYVSASSHSGYNFEVQFLGHNTVIQGLELYIHTTKVTTDNPYSYNDWYRMLFNAHYNLYAQKRVAGTVTTFYSGVLLSTEQKLKIRVKDNIVELYEADTLRASDTYALGSRNIYIIVSGRGADDVGTDWLDNVWIRKFVDPEPSHGAWGSEEISARASVMIDQAFVSDERADVGSVQTVGFHAKWNNGSDVVGGSIYVNGTKYVTNSTGWISIRAAARREAPDNFTIIALPDTQFYSASHPEIFESQTQWVVNNAQSMNIVFVTHEGDIVDDYSSLSQWNNANNSMSKLDAGNVSYGVLPGNHDGSPLHLSNFNEFFNYSRFNGKSWYGGAYQNENANNFELFHGGQDDYLIFHFQYDPSDQVLTWANSTLQNYPNRRVIVTTHSYLNVDGSRTDIGNRIWQNFVAPHADQIFLVLCGHNHGETQRTDIINGHTVYQIIADYQDRTNGGNGWLRTLEFHPVEDKIYVRTYSPYLNNYETDADSQFTLDYDITWVASSIVEKVKWIVTGVNCSGVTAYSQIVQNPSIIWDRIKIIDGGITKGSVMLGETVTIWFQALYEYDNDIFDNTNGVLYVNGSQMSWSTTNNRWEYYYTPTTLGSKAFIISGVSDSSYGLTVINDTVGAQTLNVWSSSFSVTSNSTITELVFNSTSKILSFTVNGTSGTIGYTNVTIAKTLIGDLSELKIYLDGNQIDYTTTSTEYTWLIHITYPHSTHKVVMVLSSLHANSSYTVSPEATAIFSGIIIVILAAILLVYKKVHKKRARRT